MQHDLDGDMINFLCRSAWNIVFISSQCMLPPLSLFTEFSFFFSLGLTCSCANNGHDCRQCSTLHWASLSCEKRPSASVSAQAGSQEDANVWTEDASSLPSGNLSVGRLYSEYRICTL